MIKKEGEHFIEIWDVPAKVGGKGKTQYVKIIDKSGETIKFYHDSYDKAGNLYSTYLKYERK